MNTITHARAVRLNALGAAALLSLGMGSAQAARPLTVDDTGILDTGTCQLEAWQDHDAGTRDLHLAPSCGVLPGVEFNVEAIRGTPHDEMSQGTYVGLRWAPEFAQWQGWQFGARTGWLREHSPGERHWQAGEWTAGLMATRPVGDDVTVLVNLGHTHLSSEQGLKLTTYGVALAWTPHPRWVLFAEALGAVHKDTDLGAGLRYWVIPEVLGLDATATRTTTRDANTVWGLGFGWYGIRF